MKRFGWKLWGSLFIVMAIIVFQLIAKRMEDTAVFHRFLARHAAETAVDCGIIPIETSPEPGYACAFAAKQAEKGFFLQIQRPAIDSKIADGWVVTQNGQLLTFHYDSDPSGGNHTGSIIYQQTCANPELSVQQITCDFYEAPIYIPLSFRDTIR